MPSIEKSSASWRRRWYKFAPAVLAGALLLPGGWMVVGGALLGEYGWVIWGTVLTVGVLSLLLVALLWRLDLLPKGSGGDGAG